MIAFLDLLNNYAIWIYIAGVVGILFGIKMLVDSRRLARTTLFTLEQEQANDKAFRAILTMLLFMGLIGAVSAINTFVGPERPLPAGAVVRQTEVIYTPPVWLPTNTPVPTQTTVSDTATPPPSPPRETPTAALTVGQPSVAPTRTPAPSLTPTPSPSPGFVYSDLPTLSSPGRDDTVGGGRFQFVWGGNGIPSTLPAGQVFILTIGYEDSKTKQTVSIQACSLNTSLDTGSLPQITDAHGQALNDKFSWSVQVWQSSDPAGCSGLVAPISPASETHIFTWH